MRYSSEMLKAVADGLKVPLSGLLLELGMGSDLSYLDKAFAMYDPRANVSAEFGADEFDFWAGMGDAVSPYRDDVEGMSAADRVIRTFGYVLSPDELANPLVDPFDVTWARLCNKRPAWFVLCVLMLAVEGADCYNNVDG